MPTYEVTTVVEMMQTFVIRAASEDDANDIAHDRSRRQQLAMFNKVNNLVFGDIFTYIGPSIKGVQHGHPK